MTGLIGHDFAVSLDALLSEMLPMKAHLEQASLDKLPGPELRAKLASLGFFRVALDSSNGGFDLSPRDLVPVFYTAGFHLIPTVMREEAVAVAPALAATAENGDHHAADLLTALVDGSLNAGIVLGRGEEGLHSSSGDVDLRDSLALMSPEASILFVPFGQNAAVVDSSSFDAAPATGVDLGQGLVYLTGSATPYTRPFVSGNLELRMLTAAAELVGCADKALELALAYTTQREQFGRALAGFQAVAHMLADMKAKVELSRSTVSRLAEMIERDEAADFAFLTLYSVAHMARQVCELAIQVHGGTGFTWEYGLHLFYRRVLFASAIIGGASDAAKYIGRAYIARQEAAAR